MIECEDTDNEVLIIAIDLLVLGDDEVEISLESEHVGMKKNLLVKDDMIDKN